MRLPSPPSAVTRRLTLTRQVALLSLIPIVALGFVLARVLQTQLVARTLADQSQSARLIARIGIQPRLTPADLRTGLNAAEILALDHQLRTRIVTRDLARIKIWNTNDTIIYSDDHSLIGRRLTPSDELEKALAGRPNEAIVVHPAKHSETAGEVGLGTLVEVYVPLRFSTSGRPAGAFEMYLSYGPVAGAIARDKTMIAVLIAGGLALLWIVLYRIVARASRRLREQARENSRLARYDQLTGLPNRTLFAERVDAMLRRLAATERAAVLVVDLDGFKQINNTLGKVTGDRLLQEVAGRLRGVPLEGAVTARLGNDEFAILAPSANGVDAAMILAGAVQQSLEEPVTLDGIALNVESSIGIATAPGDGVEALVLLQRAETALARARADCTRVETYSAERDSFDPTRLILLGQVRPALEHEEFVLHYQPKLDLASGRTVGVEALLRWQHPERGLLAPLEFISLIEQTALVGPLALKVIEMTARQLATLHEGGVEIGASLNLSARNLLDEELPGIFFEILRRHGIDPASIVVEVTESATMLNPEKAVAVLQALREQGVGVSIDDFGTGNASIEYLARLPATELKIDQSFILPICEDARAEAIVRSTIDLARHLDLKVVAEGIETAAMLDRVVGLGCDMGQGFLISRPLPAAGLAAYLAAERASAESAIERRARPLAPTRI